MTIGQVGILNVGAGDIKISFNSDDEAEKIRAGRVVKEMLRRGYALLVEVDHGKYQRAKDFDPDTNEYIIADYDPTVEDESDEKLQAGTEAGQEATASKGRKNPKKKAKKKRVKASDTHGVAVSKTAGG